MATIMEELGLVLDQRGYHQLIASQCYKSLAMSWPEVVVLFPEYFENASTYYQH